MGWNRRIDPDLDDELDRIADVSPLIERCAECGNARVLFPDGDQRVCLECKGAHRSRFFGACPKCGRDGDLAKRISVGGQLLDAPVLVCNPCAGYPNSGAGSVSDDDLRWAGLLDDEELDAVYGRPSSAPKSACRTWTTC